MSPKFWRFILPLLLILSESLCSSHILMAHRQHGELCDYRSPVESCDESKGLACSYRSQRCTCWDIRTIYSPQKGRCVGRAGEECHLFGGERLCTENAYCLEDEALSSLPICLCLKGYYKAGDGTCKRRSKFGEFCDHPSKVPVTVPSSLSSSSPSSSNCETGLQCINYSCQCEVKGQVYDPERELCISSAGMPCSVTLNNCAENSECVEKVYALDYASGRTNMIGHRCSCLPGFKVTYDKQCGVEYGGDCKSSSDCLSSEKSTCINGKCQCHPLSEVYDWRVKRCLTLVGGKCTTTAPQKKEDRISYVQQDSQHVVDLRESGRPQTTFPPPTTTTTATTLSSSEATTARSTTKATTTASIKTNTSTTTPKTTSTSIPSSSSSSTTTSSSSSSPSSIPSSSETGLNGSTIPISIISSRNLSGRSLNFFRHHPHDPFIENGRFGGGGIGSPPSGMHFAAPRFYDRPREVRQQQHRDHDHDYTNELLPEHRSSSSSSLSVSSPLECVSNAECRQSSTSSESVCTCKPGSTETSMRTCLLDYGEFCGERRLQQQMRMARVDDISDPSPGLGHLVSPVECNIFQGLACRDGRCECADPILIYDNKTRSCVSTVGNPCGKMRVNSKLINSLTHFRSDKVESGRVGDSSAPEDLSNNIPPFSVYQSEPTIYINCEEDALCVEKKSGNGQFRQICAPRIKFQPNGIGVGFAS